MSRGPTTEDLPGSITTTGEITSVIPRPQLNEVNATFRHRIEGESLPLQPAGRVHQAAPEHGEPEVGSPVLVVFLAATGAANLCLLWCGTSECNSLVLAFVFYLHNGSLATIS